MWQHVHCFLCSARLPAAHVRNIHQGVVAVGQEGGDGLQQARSGRVDSESAGQTGAHEAQDAGRKKGVAEVERHNSDSARVHTCIYKILYVI